MDRKYSHRGYRDAEKQDKKERSHDRKPPQGGPRADQFGPRTPRMVGTVTRARCSNCGAVLTSGFDPTPRTTAPSTNFVPPWKKTPRPPPTRRRELTPPRLPRRATMTPAKPSRTSSRSRSHAHFWLYAWPHEYRHDSRHSRSPSRTTTC